jgi:hypothetical protein
MTVHDLHDALNDLPSDLITAADRVRTKQTPKVIRWQRWVSLAAVLTLVIGTTLVFRRNLGMEMTKMESAVTQAPAAAAPKAPVPMEDAVAAEEAIPKAPAQDSATGTVTENGICIDHSHRFAEPVAPGEVPSGYCGELTVTVTIAGEPHFLTGADALAMTEILRALPYDPAQVCRCMTDITVDCASVSGVKDVYLLFAGDVSPESWQVTAE